MNQSVGRGHDHDLSAVGQVRIPAGDTRAFIDISVLDDSVYEVSETLIVDLTGVSHAGLGGSTRHTLTIHDNDSMPTLTVSDVSASESSGRAFISSEFE